MERPATTKPTTIDEYIAGCDKELQPKLVALRAIIREEAPQATEKISYGMPTFYLKENLVHFALAARHIGFYPSPSGVEAFQSQLAGYKWSKGAIQFPKDEPLPEDLIRRIVRFRVAEVTGE